MDSIFPSTQTYQITAHSGKLSLDEYALIKDEDQIQLSFVHPISDDKDLSGLMAYFQTPGGDQAGKAITYTLSQFDKPLPPFSVPEELKPGPYVLVIHVMGWNQETLLKTEKPVYYMGASDYEIKNITAYLPGTSVSNIVPLKCYVLLEAKLQTLGDIDPYIAWYNGKTMIGGGRLSEGANRMLWKAPAQTGFQQIRAEALPFPPLWARSSSRAAKAGSTLRGKMRELSLPVSSKSDIQQVLIGTKGPEKLSAYYLFAGDLRDAVDKSSQKELVPLPQKDASKRKTNWLPAENLYGLVIGPDDIYYTPTVPQKRSSAEWGWGSFTFRFMPLNEGNIFHALYSTSEDAEGHTGSAAFELALEAEGLVVTLTSEDQAERIFTPHPLTEKLSTITINYLIKNDSITVSLGKNEISVPVKGNLNQLKYQLGAVKNDADSDEALPVVVMDEFAARYSAEPAPAETSPKDQ